MLKNCFEILLLLINVKFCLTVFNAERCSNKRNMETETRLLHFNFFFNYDNEFISLAFALFNCTFLTSNGGINLTEFKSDIVVFAV